MASHGHALHEDIINALCEFLEAAVHEVLYATGVYPKDTFERRDIYTTKVHKNRHPLVDNYVGAVVHKLKPLLHKSLVAELAIVRCDPQGTVIQRIVLQVERLELHPAVHAVDWHALTSNFTNTLIKLQHIDSFGYTQVPQDIGWELHVHCTSRDGLDLTFWEETDRASGKGQKGGGSGAEESSKTKKKIDAETERLLTQLLLRRAAALQDASEDRGVLAFCGQPVMREKPNERFLQNTLKGVFHANKRVDEALLWEQRELQRQREEREERARREAREGRHSGRRGGDNGQREERARREAREGRHSGHAQPSTDGGAGDLRRDGQEGLDERRSRERRGGEDRGAQREKRERGREDGMREDRGEGLEGGHRRKRRGSSRKRQEAGERREEQAAVHGWEREPDTALREGHGGDGVEQSEKHEDHGVQAERASGRDGGHGHNRSRASDDGRHHRRKVGRSPGTSDRCVNGHRLGAGPEEEETDRWQPGDESDSRGTEGLGGSPSHRDSPDHPLASLQQRQMDHLPPSDGPSSPHASQSLSGDPRRPQLAHGSDESHPSGHEQRSPMHQDKRASSREQSRAPTPSCSLSPAQKRSGGRRSRGSVEPENGSRSGLSGTSGSEGARRTGAGPGHSGSGSASDEGDGSDGEGGGWIMGDDELHELLSRHTPKGRGSVGSRVDEPGPYLPPGATRPALEGIARGPAVPPWLAAARTAHASLGVGMGMGMGVGRGLIPDPAASASQVLASDGQLAKLLRQVAKRKVREEEREARRARRAHKDKKKKSDKGKKERKKKKDRKEKKRKEGSPRSSD